LHETEVIPLPAAAAEGRADFLAATSEVYGKSQTEAFTEADDLVIGPPHRSRWSYACSKTNGEFSSARLRPRNGHPHARGDRPALVNTLWTAQTGRYGNGPTGFIRRRARRAVAQGLRDGRQNRASVTSAHVEGRWCDCRNANAARRPGL